ncbi:MAG: hypothetical protein E7190_00435 [Erysipelotrichaceae bacterium]|nr:hypothetical protein [Erysipelotrichaceae bacterium]
MAKSYKYSVMLAYDAGFIRVGCEMSHHNSKAAAFRSLHHFENIYPKDGHDFYVEDNDTGRLVLEIKQRNSKGKWVVI